MPSSPVPVSPQRGGTERAQVIVDVLVDAFAGSMRAGADAFRTRFRRMAADRLAFYRGSACLPQA